MDFLRWSYDLSWLSYRSRWLSYSSWCLSFSSSSSSIFSCSSPSRWWSCLSRSSSVLRNVWHSVLDFLNSEETSYKSCYWERNLSFYSWKSCSSCSHLSSRWCFSSSNFYNLAAILNILALHFLYFYLSSRNVFSTFSLLSSTMWCISSSSELLCFNTSHSALQFLKFSCVS